MAPAVHVPVNTMLADLDDAVRRLLETELEGLGFAGVDISFDAPTRDWSTGVSGPTLNLFLYDIRESEQAAVGELAEQRVDGRAIRRRPPLHLDCAYSITAWANAVRDEHRMLSQALAVLLAHERLPASIPGVEGGVKTRVGRPKREGAADYWTALGGQYKLSLDYVATLPCDPGVSFPRGPDTRTQTVRLGDRTGPRGLSTELHRTGGVVRDAGGDPVPGAQLLLPDVGVVATSGTDGRFVFERVPVGTHRCECRTPAGATATAEVVVPGAGLDLVLAGE